MNDKIDELHYIYKMIGNYGFCTVQELLEKYVELEEQLQRIEKDCRQKDNAIDECIELIALIIRDVEENNILPEISDFNEILEKLQQGKGSN